MTLTEVMQGIEKLNSQLPRKIRGYEIMGMYLEVDGDYLTLHGTIRPTEESLIRDAEAIEQGIDYGPEQVVANVTESELESIFSGSFEPQWLLDDEV